jgi:predicted DNA-binding WGR domain protein
MESVTMTRFGFADYISDDAMIAVTSTMITVNYGRIGRHGAAIVGDYNADPTRAVSVACKRLPCVHGEPT